MNAITILFALGILLLALEVFVPGMVLGVIGGLALLGGVVVAFQSYGARGGLGAFAAALALVGAVLVIEFVVLPRTSFGRRMFLKTDVAGTSQPPLADASVVGKPAKALTALVPSGYVSIEGKRYDAFSQSGHVHPGETLRVVGLDNFRVIVTKS
ncbi:MAG: serine protease [Opitutaceae bacterium]|nr:serine protease [Opitutaceae bacterium]